VTSHSSKSKRRGRSRKRRPVVAAGVAQNAVPRGRDRVVEPSSSKPAAAGGRPRAPWHPLPLSELLIAIGAIGTVLGLTRGGGASNAPLLFAAIGAVMIGTIEVTLREHRSGYRSHTVMLAGLLVLVFDSVLVLVLTAITSLPRLFSVALIAIDFALFAFLFKLLRARFLDARHARVIREG
jgi:hypothetical protein